MTSLSFARVESRCLYTQLPRYVKVIHPLTQIASRCLSSLPKNKNFSLSEKIFYQGQIIKNSSIRAFHWRFKAWASREPEKVQKEKEKGLKASHTKKASKTQGDSDCILDPLSPINIHPSSSNNINSSPSKSKSHKTHQGENVPIANGDGQSTSRNNGKNNYSGHSSFSNDESDSSGSDSGGGD